MNSFPMWWVYLSGFFFAVNTVLLIGLIVLVIKLIDVVNHLKPQITSVTQKVDSIAGKVDTLTSTLNDTVASLGSRAKNVGSSADLIASTASKAFERHAPIVMGIMTAFRVLSAINDHRNKHPKPKTKPVQKALPKK